MCSIFIPFHDGLLDLDCQECGAECCQAGNIVATENERDILVQENPFIRFFGAGEENHRHTLHKHPQCWFLEKDLRCEIQRKHGYSLKPFICRLHPFYVARCRNEHVVITSGCEMLYATRPGTTSQVTRDSVIANAREAIDCGFVSEQIDWPEGRLDFEREVLDESSTYLNDINYLDFAAFQLAASRREKNRSEARAQLDRSLYLWKRLLGIEEIDFENQQVCYELVAMTPLLRVAHPGLRNMETDRIPAALLALYVYMILFSQGREVRRIVATYRSVLDDVPIGLAYLTEEDLRIQHQPLEKKLHYIRALRRMHEPGFLKGLKQNPVDNGKIG